MRDARNLHADHPFVFVFVGVIVFVFVPCVVVFVFVFFVVVTHSSCICLSISYTLHFIFWDLRALLICYNNWFSSVQICQESIGRFAKTSQPFIERLSEYYELECFSCWTAYICKMIGSCKMTRAYFTSCLYFLTYWIVFLNLLACISKLVCLYF